MLASSKYGIVIDSGSSGSRIQIYRWEDPNVTKKTATESELTSPPKIVQEEGWSHKISPGISSFAGKTSRIWKDHYKGLIEFALKIIPPEKVAETPIYVLSTAGMRLVPEKSRKAILKETCKLLQKNTKLLISDCDLHVQTIDGGTEGIYGWLALNYLMGQFNEYSAGENHESIGFMDMGGASTQIAFVPSLAEEITRHDEDLSKVVVRNINGQLQMWRVFVETWLGFGANQARTRYLRNLIHLASGSQAQSTTKKLVLDPCMPKNAEIKGYEYAGHKYTIKGTGNHESCVKDIYPLLMKHLECVDEPCLFNGIHSPKMNFETDKFVGVSEYWYTANDIFHSGGEYNFHSFNEKVKEFCESLWENVLKNSKEGKYSKLPELFLYDACFKASWVINVLHEGFELPRLGVDIDNAPQTPEMKDVEKVHVPFKSADSVNGDELSWTLGKILLVASSQIQAQDKLNVGITLSEISQKHDSDDDGSDDDDAPVLAVYTFVVLALLVFLVYKFGLKHMNRIANSLRKPAMHVPTSAKPGLNWVKSHSPSFVRPYIARVVNYIELEQQTDTNRDLESGYDKPLSTAPSQAELSVLRTRSSINLAEADASRPVDFLNKPFTNVKKNPGVFEKDPLPRLSSTSSVVRKPT